MGFNCRCCKGLWEVKPCANGLAWLSNNDQGKQGYEAWWPVGLGDAESLANYCPLQLSWWCRGYCREGDTVVLLGPRGTLWAAFKGSGGQCRGWGRRGFTSSMGSSRCLLFSMQHMWLNHRRGSLTKSTGLGLDAYQALYPFDWNLTITPCLGHY